MTCSYARLSRVYTYMYEALVHKKGGGADSLPAASMQLCKQVHLTSHIDPSTPSKLHSFALYIFTCFLSLQSRTGIANVLNRARCAPHPQTLTRATPHPLIMRVTQYNFIIMHAFYRTSQTVSNHKSIWSSGHVRRVQLHTEKDCIILDKRGIIDYIQRSKLGKTARYVEGILWFLETGALAVG